MDVGECSKEVARKISVVCHEIVYQDKIYQKMVSLEYEVQFEGKKSMSTEEIRQEYVRKNAESPRAEGRSIHRALLTWCLRWKKQGKHARLQPLCRQGVVGQCLLKNQGEEDCEPMAAVLVSSNIGLQITNQNVNRICRCKGFNLWKKKKKNTEERGSQTLAHIFVFSGQNRKILGTADLKVCYSKVPRFTLKCHLNLRFANWIMTMT